MSILLRFFPVKGGSPSLLRPFWGTIILATDCSRGVLVNELNAELSVLHVLPSFLVFQWEK